MGYGLSIFFVAVGAVLTWAVDASVQGIDLRAVGVILMVVGGLGLMVSLLYWSNGAPRRGTRTTVVDDRDLAP